MQIYEKLQFVANVEKEKRGFTFCPVIPSVEILKLADIRSNEHLTAEFHQALVAPAKSLHLVSHDLHAGRAQEARPVPSLAALSEVFLHKRPLVTVNNPAPVFPLEPLYCWI